MNPPNRKISIYLKRGTQTDSNHERQLSAGQVLLNKTKRDALLLDGILVVCLPSQTQKVRSASTVACKNVARDYDVPKNRRPVRTHTV